MTEYEFDKIIENSVKNYGHDYFELSAPPHEFSSHFKRKMSKLTSSQKRRTNIIRILSAAAAIIVISVVSVSLLTMKSIPSDMMTANQTSIQSEDIIMSSDEKIHKNEANETDNTHTDDYNNYIDGITEGEYAESDQAEEGTKSIIQQNENIPATENAENFAAPENDISTSLLNVAVVKNNHEIFLDSSKSAEIEQLILTLLEDTIRKENRTDAESISKETAQYTIFLKSGENDPLMYDENGRAVTFISLFLNNERSSVLFNDGSQAYNFTLASPQDTYESIEAIIS